MLLALAAVYGGQLSAPLIYDDIGAIVENPRIRSLWPPWEAAWAPRDTAAAGRPVIGLSLAVNYAISGTAPWSYRLLNIALHGVAALLLFQVTAATLTSPRAPSPWRRHRRGLAALLALLWALHPLQTEAVMYVIQRTELLGSLFILATMAAAMQAWRDKRLRSKVLAVLSCAAGMASKEIAVAAPLLVLLHDRAFFAGTFRAAWRAHGRLHGALFGCWGILAALLATAPRAKSVGFDLVIGPLEYLRTQASVLMHYLRLVVWPDPLTVLYPEVPIPWREAILPGLAVLGLLGLTAWALIRRPRVATPGVWFFLVLAPSSSFVPIVTEVAAERRMHLPLAAVLGVVLCGAAALAARLPRPHATRAGAAGLATLLAAACAGASAHRVHDEFHSEIAIWRAVLEAHPHHPKARSALAAALAARGTGPAMAEAERHLLAVAERFPETPRSYTNLAHLRIRQKRWAAARALARKALELDRSNHRAWNHLGLTWANEGKLDRAIRCYRRALKENARYAEAQNNLGAAMLRHGRLDKARKHLRRAVRWGPRIADARYNLALLRQRRGEREAAQAALRKAVSLEPTHTRARLALAQSLAKEAALSRAEKHLRALLEHHPAHADAHNSLGTVLARQGHMNEAMTHFEKALAARPNWEAARRNLERARTRTQPTEQ